MVTIRQALQRDPPRATICGGFSVTRGGAPCNVDFDLDVHGYCQQHSPLNLQCRGWAHTKGRRCLIRENLDDNVLCRFHWMQIVQCHYVDRVTEHRCVATGDAVDWHGFCDDHRARDEDDLVDGFQRIALGHREEPAVAVVADQATSSSDGEATSSTENEVSSANEDEREEEGSAAASDGEN